MIHADYRTLIALLWGNAEGRPRPCVWLCRCGQGGTSHTPAESVRAHLAAWHGGG